MDQKRPWMPAKEKSGLTHDNCARQRNWYDYSIPFSRIGIRKKRERAKSGLRHQKHVIHKQRVNARLAKRDDRVGGCANDWFAVVERRIDDERHAGFRKETGYELVKARI
jgi:hypothetical protein